MQSREFSDIKKAAEEVIKEKKARNEKCTVNYLEVSKRVGYLPCASVAMYLSKNHKKMGLQSLCYNPSKPHEYVLSEAKVGGCTKLRNYLSKLF